MRTPVPGTQRLRRGIVLAGAVLIGAIVTSYAFDVWRSHRQHVGEVDRELGNLSKALAADATHRFQAVDLLLRDTVRWYRASAGKLRDAQVSETLGNLLSGSPVQALFIADPEGTLLHSSRRLPADVVSAEDTTFAVLEGRPGLLMSQDLRINASLVGRARAVVDLAEFQSLYEAIHLGPGNAIFLMRDDGALLARRPALPGAMGRQFPEFPRLREAQAAGKQDATLIVSPIDGVPRFAVYTSVRNLPLFVAVTRDESVALAPWRQRTLNGAVRNGGLALLCALLIAAFVRQLARTDVGARAMQEQAALLDLTHDAVFVRGMNDVITYWNRGAEELYGWTAAQAIGQTTHRVLQTRFPEPLERIREELLRSGRWEGELLHTKRDGTQVSVASRWALQRDDSGNTVGVLETNNDITERKRSEADLLRETALLDQLFEGGPDAVVLLDLEARVLRINHEFTALFGHTAEETAGRSIYDLIVPEEERERASAHVAEALSGRAQIETEGERLHKDGSRVQVSAKGGPIMLGGRPIGLYGIYRDITERKRAEQALRLSEERYARAMEATEAGHWEWDLVTNKVFHSARFRQLYGVAVEEKFAHRDAWKARQPLSPSERERQERALQAAIADPAKTYDIELSLEVRPGEVRWLRSKAKVFRDERGRPLRMTGVTTDITAQKLAQEALRASEARYARAMEGSDAGHWEWNIVTDELFVSVRAREMLALPAGPLPARRAEIMALAPQHPDDVALMPKDVAASIESGVHEREYRVIPRPGEVHWLHSRGRLFKDERGAAVRMTGSLADITQRKRAEEALRRSEGYLTEAQRLGRAGSWAWNVRSEQLTHFSEEAYRVVGFDPQAGLPSTEALRERIHPGDRARHESVVSRALREGKDFETNFRVCLPDFTLKYLHGVGRPVFNASGEIVEVVGTLRDVTEHRRADEALRQSEEQWKAVFEHNPTMYFMVDAAGAIVSVNAFGAEQLGYTMKDLVGRPVEQVFEPGSRGMARVHLAACLEHLGRTMTWELRKQRKDGTLLWVRETAKGVLIKKRPVVLIVCEDITESKQARQDLRESEARYRNIFETVGVSIWEEDFSQLKAAIDGLKERGVQDWPGYLAAHPEFVRKAVSMIRVVDVNDATLKLFEAASKDELIASLDRIFLPETLEVFARELVAIAEGRTFFEAETVLQTLKGVRVTVLFTITFPQPQPDARFDSVLVTLTDITEQRAREREREELQRQLQQAARLEAIGRLAGGIAHDFNNILGAILGYGELAQRHLGEQSRTRRHVDQVMNAGARGKGLVERILAFSRSGLGERVPVHVEAVVEETLGLLAASLPVGVQLERSLDAGDAAILGDATQLHQVVMNLCTNALQAIVGGGVLAVALERVALPERRLLSHGVLAPGDYVRLSVRDTGRGIARGVLEHMFDPFFTTKRVGDGTGLGLALVHGIVADFGGAIDVATAEGAGTTFTVWLPAAGETPRPLAEAGVEVPRGNGETVMIVDDEPALVGVAEETLAELGYDPAGFDSSVAALEAFRAEPGRFDLVLTDETMPDLSGVELAREIRGVRPELPIVLMSGYSGVQLWERAQEAGVAEVLRKPLVRRDIAEALMRALGPLQHFRGDEEHVEHDEQRPERYQDGDPADVGRG